MATLKSPIKSPGNNDKDNETVIILQDVFDTFEEKANKKTTELTNSTTDYPSTSLLTSELNKKENSIPLGTETQYLGGDKKLHDFPSSNIDYELITLLNYYYMYDKGLPPGYSGTEYRDGMWWNICLGDRIRNISGNDYTLVCVKVMKNNIVYIYIRTNAGEYNSVGGQPQWAILYNWPYIATVAQNYIDDDNINSYVYNLGSFLPWTVDVWGPAPIKSKNFTELDGIDNSPNFGIIDGYNDRISIKGDRVLWLNNDGNMYLNTDLWL
jgi:hypothetical protein